MKQFISVSISFFFFAVVPNLAFARTWTANGVSIEANLLAYDASRNEIWLTVPGRNKPSKVDFTILDDASKEYVLKNEANLVEYKGMLMTMEAKEKRESNEKKQQRDMEISNSVHDNISLIVFDLAMRKAGKPEKCDVFAKMAKELGLPPPPSGLLSRTCETAFSYVESFPKKGAIIGSYDHSFATIEFIYRREDESKLFRNSGTKGCGYAVFTGEKSSDSILVCPDKKLAETLSKIYILRTSVKSQVGANVFKPSEELTPYQYDSSRVKIRHDDFDDEDWFSEDAPSVETTWGSVKLSMKAVRQGASTSLLCIAIYLGEDWIFVRDVTVLGANGERFSFSDNSPRQEVLTGKVYESAVAEIKHEEVNNLKSILTSGKVRVRFAPRNSSSGYILDWEMRGFQIRSCLDIINTYESLQHDDG